MPALLNGCGMRISVLNVAIASALLVLTACSEKKNTVKITADEPVETPAKRSEPIFYNGKTYRLSYSRLGDGSYDMSVAGMTAKQQKDATAVATSSLRYFACKDSQQSQLVSGPSFAQGTWRMNAKCV
jgi:hypothetical protein